MRKIWNVKKCDAGQAAALAAETGISTLLAGVLLNRGIDNREKVEEFLHPEKWEYHDPYLLPDMAAAVKRIRQAILLTMQERAVRSMLPETYMGSVIHKQLPRLLPLPLKNFQKSGRI